MKEANLKNKVAHVFSTPKRRSKLCKKTYLGRGGRDGTFFELAPQSIQSDRQSGALFFSEPRVGSIPHRQFEHVLDTRPTTNIHTELKRRKIKGSRATVTKLKGEGRRSVSKSATRASAESTPPDSSVKKTHPKQTRDKPRGAPKAAWCDVRRKRAPSKACSDKKCSTSHDISRETVSESGERTAGSVR